MGFPHAFVELLFDLTDDIARTGNWFRKNPIAGLGVLFLAIFLGLFSHRLIAGSEIFTATFWERDPEGIRNLVWAMATIFAGAAGLYGLLLAGRRTASLDRQAQIAHEHRVLAEQGQITDRFTKAVEQLGHSEVAVRLGAIYALERVAKDSERDFGTIVETLAAFVRHHARQDATATVDDLLNEDVARQPAIDVSAAIVVMARIIPMDSPMRIGALSLRADLRNLDLRGLDLPGANFSGFRFDGSSLSGANLCSTNCERASFVKVDLVLAHLADANFRSSTFSSAQLYRTSVDRSDFSQARFFHANLDSLQASYADFSEANLYSANLRSAFLWKARLCKANLTNVALDQAILDASDLEGAIMDSTSLKGTFANGANFRGAVGLKPDQLHSVKYDEGTEPLGLEHELFQALPEPVAEFGGIPF